MMTVFVFCKGLIGGNIVFLLNNGCINTNHNDKNCMVLSACQ